MILCSFVISETLRISVDVFFSLVAGFTKSDKVQERFDCHLQTAGMVKSNREELMKIWTNIFPFL